MERQYYIASGKDNLGPFTLSQLKDKKLKSDTLVWYEGLEKWTKAEDLEELKANITTIVSPPLTPLQVEEEEKKIKLLITRKQIEQSAKYAGVVFLFAFVIYGIVQYVALDKANDTANYYNRMNSEDIFISALTSALLMSFLFSLIALSIFYYIQKQKPCRGLLTFSDKKDNELYQGIIDRQEEKYDYSKPLDSIPCLIGYIILGLNLIFGFFPEHKLWYDIPDSGYGTAIISICIRVIISLTYVGVLVEAKNRSFLWTIFTFILPAIGLIIVGSLYPIKVKSTKSKVIDKGEEYLCTSNSDDETKKSHE